MVWREVSVVDGSVNVCGGGTKNGEAVRVFGAELGVRCTFCCIFGFGRVDGKASLLHVLLDDGSGFVYEVGRDPDVQVVEVGVCDGGCRCVSMLVSCAELLDVVLDL